MVVRHLVDDLPQLRATREVPNIWGLEQNVHW
jgi:hypothetical protein